MKTVNLQETLQKPWKDLQFDLHNKEEAMAIKKSCTKINLD